MPPDRKEVAAALMDTPIFRSLDDAQLSRVIDVLETGTLTIGETLFREGDQARHFYIILSGKICLTQARQNRQNLITNLTAGDYFGEEALSRRGRRPVTATAGDATQLLRLDARALKLLFREIPSLKANLQIAASTHRLVQHVRLEWLNPEEAVFLMARKHLFFLGEGLAGPALAALVSFSLMGLFYFQLLPGTITPVLLTGLVYLASLGWGIWNYLDWSNDYNIVTNQRVVWLERVAAIYDSRQEAPLTTLLSVGVKTTQVGRWVGFGDVLVRTYTGVMALRRVAHPEQVAFLIEQHWTRSKTISRQAETEAIERTIRQRLKLSAAGPVEPVNQAAKTFHEVEVEVQPGWLQSLFANFFHVRFEDGPVVTYRKHWYILFRETWKPVFLLGMTAGIAFLRLTNLFTLLSHTVVFVACAAAGIGLFLWFLYEYLDWRNDIYQVTPEQIVDSDKKPLGKEERKAAPLENILSIEYQRLGIIGLLLNFGTVSVTIGASRFTFDYVYNPSQVQQDIFRRMNERIEGQKRADAVAERERLSDWIAIYHQNMHPDADPLEDLPPDPAGNFPVPPSPGSF